MGGGRGGLGWAVGPGEPSVQIVVAYPFQALGLAGGFGGDPRIIFSCLVTPIPQPEALYCTWAWICGKPEATISQPAKKLTFCMVLQSDGEPLRKHIHV